jgi:hypothetical protein
MVGCKRKKRREKMTEEGYPKTIARIMSEAGLIVEEEELAIENYLRTTHAKGVN